MSPFVKTSLALCCALFSIAPAALAAPSRLQLTGEAGVGATFDLGVDSSGGRGTLSADGGAVYGGRLSYRVHPTGFVYLSYHRELTTAYFREAGEFEPSASAAISFDHFQFGGRLEVPRGTVFPYAGFGIGALRVGSQETNGASVAFSLALDMGVRWEILPFLHLGLMGRLPITFLTGDSGAFCVNNSCRFTYRGDPLVQIQALLGAGVQF
jgi:hypothetical protein